MLPRESYATKPAAPSTPPPWIYIAAALGYFAAFDLGLWSTASGDIVTPVWLAAGLSIWLVLRFGRGLLLVVALVGLAANMQETQPFTRPSALAMWLTMAAGDTLTAALGVRLWRHVTDRWQAALGEFCEPLAVMATALLTPVVAATIGTAAIVLTGNAPGATAPSLWIAWWSGDALGTLFGLPLLLAAPAIYTTVRQAGARQGARIINPLSPASGPATSSFNGLHLKSNFLAFIEPSGVVTAAHVYQDSPAVVAATHAGLSDRLGLTILNISDDDFGSYAADGLADSWQVRYFGEGNAQAGPNPDADGDGLSNLLEFAFGTDPMVSNTSALVYTGTLAGNGTITSTGQPITKFEPSGNGVDFRALFVLRKDYLAAGLTYTPQFSATLSSWQNSAAVPTVLADDGTTYQIVSVPYPVFIAGKKAQYFRMGVSGNP